MLSAITSVQQRIKLYNKTPPNGLIIYCGTVVSEETGKEKKINFDLEPFRPVNKSLYLCDNKFHTGPLAETLSSDNRFGFIVMDGHGALFGLLQGSRREVLQKFGVDLPRYKIGELFILLKPSFPELIRRKSKLTKIFSFIFQETRPRRAVRPSICPPSE